MSHRNGRLPITLVAVLGVGTLLAGCAVTSPSAPSSSTVVEAGSDSESSAGALFDSDVVHTISVEFDQAEYDAIIAAYVADGSKEWLSATVTIDGTVLEGVGLRLKGNSSLRALGGETAPGGATDGDGLLSADDPASVPWLIRLDQFVDDQTYDGRSEFIVRGNNTETSLNEAVALELLGAAGLATQEATAVRFSVNGGEETLRLVIESPDDPLWSDAVFGENGITYEAETEGDYAYRGDDPTAYADAFTQQSGGDDDLSPVIALLDFVGSSSDDEFVEQLGEYLDVDAFADYLALETLIANSDDIDGPGNNSYLRWDADTGLITVVAWDHNLAFGGFGHAGAGGPGAQGAQDAPGAPDAQTAPGGGAGQRPGGQGGGPGGMQKSNPLTERFTELFGDRVAAATADLTATLYTSGAAQEILDRWTAVLEAQAGDLVDVATIESDAARIAEYFVD